MTFAQPSSSAIALNRVIGPDPSQIAGKITANGQVALVNQSGVVFYKGSQVNVSTLIVSAAGITDKNFAAGKMNFDQPARPNARIENHGDITVKETGLAALVAPQVVNSGTITAKLGHVVLAGATTHTVDLYGDGLLSIDVTGQVKQVPVGRDGKKATALVTNTGVIAADGGTITLTAQAADGIVQTLVSAGGKLRANSVGDKTGTIQVAGIGGSITVEGAVTAEGGAAGTRGGQIELVASDAVRVAAGATVSTSGRAGGGVVAVGTTLARARGGSAVKNARTAKSTVVERGATIRADATAKGDGGRVVLLSTERTDHQGAITARGGPHGGDGGFVEVSGDKGFALTGTVDLAAPAGRVGALLIDPADLEVIHSSSSSGSLDKTAQSNAKGGKTTVGFGDSVPPNTISDVTINALGSNADVTLQATNSLTVDGAAAVTGAAIVTLPSHALTLQSLGTLTLQSGSDITATTITLNGGPGLTSIGGTLHGTTSIVLTTGGDVVEPTGSMTTPNLSGNVGGELHLAGPNQIDALGNLTVGGANFTLVDGNPLTVSGTVSASASGAYIGITDTAPAGQAIGITGSLTAGPALAPDGIVRLETTQSGANVTETGGLIAAGSLEGAVGGALTLSGTGNAIANLGTPFGLTITGDLAFTDSVPVMVNGPVQAHSIAIDDTALVVGSTITLTTGGSLTTARPTGILTLTTALGDVTEPGGAIVAGTLQGTIDGVLHLAGPANQIDALGALAVNGGNLTLVDAVPLTVSGAVVSGSYIGISDSAPSGQAISIGAGGSLTALPSGVVDLTTTQNGADVIEAGGLIAAGSLQGSIGGALTLAGASNAITTLGNLTVNGGNFTLTDSVPLTAAGTVAATKSAATIGLTDSAAGAAITINGTLLAGAPFPPSPGTVLDGAVNLATSQGDVQEPSGTINAASLGGSVGGSLHLANPANVIGALGNLTISGGDFALTDSVPLTVAGMVAATKSGAYVGITDLVTTPGSTGIGITGSLTAGTVPPSDAPRTGTLELFTQPGVNVTETGGGFIRTGWFGGTIGGALILNGANNEIAAIGAPFGLTVKGGDLTLVDSVPLVVNGTVQATASGATISLTDTFGPAALGTISISGGSLLAGAPLPPPSTMRDGTVALFTTKAGADVLEPGGFINASFLAGSIGGALHLGSPNNVIGAIPAPLGLTATNDLALADSVPLTVFGPVQGRAVSRHHRHRRFRVAPNTPITAIGITGSLTTTLPTGIVRLETTQANADVKELGGSIATGSLEGAVGGTLDLSGSSNAVGSIGAPFGLTVHGPNFALKDSIPLVVNGAVLADASGATISLTDTAAPVPPATSITAISINGGSLAVPIGTANLVTTQAGADVTEPNGFIAAGFLEGSIGGALHLGGPANKIDAIGSMLGLTAGTDLTLRDSVPLTVNGAVQAGAGHLLQLSAPSLTLTTTGLLTANAIVPNIGPTPFAVTPGVIELQADAMSLANGLVSAPDGMITISRLTPGTLSLDPVTVSGNLSLTQADLGSIRTLGVTTGPLGTQTVALGSLDGLAPDPNTSQLQINGRIYSFAQVAHTLALLSTGDITETAAGTPGAVAVTALTGAAPNGHIDLSGGNLIAQTGNFATVGNYTLNGPRAVSTLTASGDLLLVNGQDLTLNTLVQAGPSAEIDVLPGNLTAAGTVTAGNVFLRGGNVTVNGSVTASSEADLVAGMAYSQGTLHPAPVFTPGAGAPGSAGAIAINGSVRPARSGSIRQTIRTRRGSSPPGCSRVRPACRPTVPASPRHWGTSRWLGRRRPPIGSPPSVRISPPATFC